MHFYECLFGQKAECLVVKNMLLCVVIGISYHLVSILELDCFQKTTEFWYYQIDFEMHKWSSDFLFL
jgi:hypothetical protein